MGSLVALVYCTVLIDSPVFWTVFVSIVWIGFVKIQFATPTFEKGTPSGAFPLLDHDNEDPNLPPERPDFSGMDKEEKRRWMHRFGIKWDPQL
jgi:hypothetical protein